MLKLKDVIEILDEAAPFSLAEDWDNSGLQVGSISTQIKRILLALNPTIMAIKKAVEIDAQLLLTHHPLIFSPLSSIYTDNYPGNVICEAIWNRISIVAMHTNLDAAENGINQILADMLELKDIKVLQYGEDMNAVSSGIGRIGSLKNNHSLDAVIKVLKKVLGLNILRVLGKNDTEIQRIAIVGGSGGSMASLAFNQGADLLITGDIKHNDVLYAEAVGLCLIDGGHFSTEYAPLVSYAEILNNIFEKRGLNIKVELFGDEKDPMRYE